MPLTTPPTLEIPLYARDPATGITYGVRAAPAPTALNDLTDADTYTTAPVATNGLVFDGANWVPVPMVLDTLTDVDTTTTAPVVGDVLVWDGTNWVPGPEPVPVATATLTMNATTFSGTINLKRIGSVVTIWGTATSVGTGIPNGGHQWIGSWPGGFGNPGKKIVQDTRTYDDSGAGHYWVKIYPDNTGLDCECVTGENFPAGRKVDISLTYIL